MRDARPGEIIHSRLANKTSVSEKGSTTMLLKRLLFVDDEPGIRNTLPVILRRYGFTVSVAATVDAALEQIRNEEFDLLLCDLNIHAESDGYTVIRAMQESNPQCVAIVLTGYPGVQSAVEGIHLGIDDYIVKPANADVLVALLAEKLTARFRASSPLRPLPLDSIQ